MYRHSIKQIVELPRRHYRIKLIVTRGLTLASVQPRFLDDATVLLIHYASLLHSLSPAGVLIAATSRRWLKTVVQRNNMTIIEINLVVPVILNNIHSEICCNHN